jgi:putative toxin-antitoxin system antitoxin component (TIGR02293 family)
VRKNLTIQTNDIIFVTYFSGMKKYKSFTDSYPPSFVSEPAVAYSPTYNGRLADAGLQVVQNARNGLKTSFFLQLGEKMGLSMQDMSKILNISLRTLQRYEDEHILDADASSKVIQLYLLQQKGLDVFGTQPSFNSWLRDPLPELDGGTPLEYLDTPFGYQILHQILGRIEHGIFA